MEPQNNVLEQDEVFGELNALTKLIDGLDDRGLVLSLAAFAEDALGGLLHTFLLKVEASTELLEGFNAPLGALSSRIKATYALGLITKDQFLDLERLRKIRNEFAHSWKIVDISNQKIQSLIQGMCFSRVSDKLPETLSEKIKSSMLSLLVEIRSSTHQIKKQNMDAKLIGRQLVAGFTGDFDEQVKSAREKLDESLQNIESENNDRSMFYQSRLIILRARLLTIPKPKTVKQCDQLLQLIKDVQSSLLKYKLHDKN